MIDEPFIPATEQELFPPVGTDEPDARHIHSAIEDAVKWKAHVIEMRAQSSEDAPGIVTADVRVTEYQTINSASGERHSTNVLDVSDLEEQPDGTYKVVDAPKRELKPHGGRMVAMLNEIGIDEVCDLIEDDKSYAAIADELGVTKRGLSYWLKSDSSRSARVRDSLRIAAAEAAQKAEDVLLALSPDATPAECLRARELAQHYRWKAKVRNPTDFGDKQQIDMVGQVGVDAAIALAKKLYGTPRVE